MAPIHIAMIIQGYHPRVGGAERQLAALAPLLGELGVRISVLTRRYPGLAPFERIAGVPVYRLPIPGPTSVGSMVFTLAALRLLQQLRPDVLHAHELLSPTTTAIAARRMYHIPVVAKVLRGGVDGDLAKLRRNRVSARRIPIIRDAVDAFVVISSEINAELASIGVPSERRCCIPNGVDLERFAPATRETRCGLREQLGLSHGPTVVFTGRLAPEKRIVNLLTIWPVVRAKHPDAQLLLVGSGPDEAKLKTMTGPGVHFTGAVTDVVPYLRAADLFVLPSSTEGLSNALLEAMAVGLPAVATAVGGAGDVIVHGENGWLIPPDDSSALQNALLEMLDNPLLAERYGILARSRVARDYTLRNTAQRLRSLYSELTDSFFKVMQ